MNTQTRRFLILAAALLALALVAGGAWWIRGAQRSRQMAVSRTEGLRLYEAGKHEEAMRTLNYFASRDKTDPKVLYALGDCRWRVPLENGRHLLSAINFLRPAVELSPGDARPLKLLLDLYIRVGFVTEALDTADRLLVIDPANAEALRVRIAALQQLGRSEQALTAARTLAEKTPGDVRAHEAVIFLMNRLGRSPEELKSYVEGVSLAHPDRAEMTLLRSRVALVQGDNEAARTIAREAAGQTIATPEALPMVLRYLDVLGLFSESDAILEAQIALEDRRLLATRIKAERLWKTGQLEEARTLLRPLVTPPESASDDALGLAAVLDSVKPATDSSTSTPTSDPVAVLRARSSRTATAWLAWLDAGAALRRGQREEARKALALIAPESLSDELVDFAEGQVRAASGEHAAALERYKRAIQSEPRWLEVRLAAIESATSIGDTVQAFALAQDTARYFPNRLSAVQSLARTGVALIEAGRAGPENTLAVRALLGQLENEKVDQSEIRTLRARVEAATGDNDSARRAIERLLDSGPVSPSALADALRLAQRINAPDLVDRIDKAGAAGPLNADLAFARAMAAAAAGRTVEGAALLRKAIEAAPPGERLGYQRALAVFLNRVGDPESVSMLVALAAEHPGDLQVQMDLLNSDRVWSSRENIQPALDRVKGLAGERSTAWRLYESRRLLTFERTPATAAEAARLLGDLLRDEPTNAAALALNGDANTVLNDPGAAIDSLGRSIDAGPDQVALYPTLISLLQSQGETDAARRRLTEFHRFTDIPDDLRRQRMQQSVFQAMWPEAERDLRAMAAKGAEGDRLQLAEFLVMRGRATEARGEYEALLAAPEPGSNTLMQAADFFAFAGDEPRAAALLDTLTKRLTPAESEMVRAAFDERHGRVLDAERRLTKAAESASDPALWAELTRFFVRQNDEQRAAETLNRALAAHPSSEPLRQLKTLFEQAAEGRVRPGEEAPGLDPAAIALVQANRERPAPASRGGADLAPYIERLRAITSAHATYFPAWQTLVATLFEAQQPAEAVSAARVALRVLPADPRSAELATRALDAAGEQAEAIAAARAWRDLAHLNPLDADLTLGRLYASAGQPADAARHLDPHKAAIAQLGERDPAPLSLYASVLTSLGRVDDARALLKGGAARPAAWGIAYLVASRPLVRDADKARAWLDDSAAFVNISDPDSRLELGKAWFDLAVVTRAEGDYRKAIEVLTPLQGDPARSVAAARVLATAHDQLGDLPAAEAQYRAILKADPNQPVIMNNLAYLLSRTRPESGEAIEMSRSALALVREQGADGAMQANFLDTLGHALLVAGLAADAEPVYRDAISLAPENSDLVAGLIAALTPRLPDSSVAGEMRLLMDRFDRLAQRRPPTETARQRVSDARQRLTAGAPR
ncbi:MAG TPA: hypothetical protein DEB06_11755 [Phycisphaerales bacterium]|nr:hypothetical protein [Phycisphaerales bacterium]